MRNLAFSSWGILLITFFLPLNPSNAQQPIFALINANVVNGQNSIVLNNAAVVIENGKISSMLVEEQPLPEGIETIDLQGKYLMPGLIDAHVHIRDWNAAYRALESGVTTVRSMGVSHFTDVGMREIVKMGQKDAPEVLAAGYHVRPEPAPGFFLDFPELADLMEEGVLGDEALYRMGKTMTSRKVDWIKVNATARAGLPDTDPREPYYTESEIRALVRAGAEAGTPVAAHAHGDEGGRAAVLGGVKSIEHGTYLSHETLALMVDRNTYLVPTIAIVADLTQPGGDYDVPLLAIRGRHMLPRVRAMAAKALELGVQIVAATDTGYGPNSTLRLSEELIEFVGIGMTNEAAIRSATSLAATMLAIGDRTGTVAEGLEADLLVIEQNPLENIAAIRDILMVINNGKVVLNRLEW